MILMERIRINQYVVGVAIKIITKRRHDYVCCSNINYKKIMISEKYVHIIKQY